MRRARQFSTVVICTFAAGGCTILASALPSAIARADTPATASETSAQLQVPRIDACLGKLDPELDIGYDRIAARCPELVKQVEQGPWAPWLPRGWNEPGNDLSGGSLREFRDLVGRENAASPSGGSPDIRGLQVVLSGLEPARPQGAWSRFKSWLRSILEAREQTPDESWFTRMVSHVGMPQSLRQLLAYAALGAVVLMALVIIVNELRAAGLLSRMRAGRERHGTGPSHAREMMWSDIDRAPLLDKPHLLLGLIVSRLGQRGYLPPAGALTVRELTRVARLSEPDDRARLAQLAGAAEQVRYSACGPETRTIEESIARGCELLERLEAS